MVECQVLSDQTGGSMQAKFAEAMHDKLKRRTGLTEGEQF